VSKLLTDAQRVAISNRTPFKVEELGPWIFGYKTRGGGYIVANDGKQSDSRKPSDLIYIHPGGGIVPLSPFLNPDLVNEVEGAVH